MPELRTRNQQPSPVNPQVPIPSDFPAIPDEVIARFPSARDWQNRLNAFWTRTNQALQEAQNQTARQVNSHVVYTVDSFLIYARNGIAEPMFQLDDTGIRLGNVLVINTTGRKVYIGAGNYASDDTPFYVDTLGNFSLGASLTWDPVLDTLTITGIINATSGTIGGFDIGADYIRDVANSFGLASTITGANDVRFWAGETFANRAIAPFRIYENGEVRLGNAFGTSLTLTGGATNAIELTGLTVSNGPTGVFDRRTLSSASTTYAYGFVTELLTSAVVFTLPVLNHFGANQGVFGAGSVVTVQTGFEAAATLTGGVSNYGFRGRLAAAAGRYNLYMDGTAQNYLAGTLTVDGAGTFPTLSLTGGVTNGIYFGGTTISTGPTGSFNEQTVGSAATTYYYGHATQISTQAAAFTLPSLTHFSANQGTVGAGSTVTAQTGFEAASTLTGATNNYGFRGRIASGSNRYNLYMDGTGQNYLAGITGIGVAASATTRLILAAGTTGLSSLRVPHGAAPTVAVDGDLWTTTAGLYVQINGVTVGPLT